VNEVEDKKFLTIEEVASILRISRTKAYELVREPGFPVIKIGKQLRIPADKFYEYCYERLS
jgi:excisionase family DNA binding protein